MIGFVQAVPVPEQSVELFKLHLHPPGLIAL